MVKSFEDIGSNLLALQSNFLVYLLNQIEGFAKNWMFHSNHSVLDVFIFSKEEF